MGLLELGKNELLPPDGEDKGLVRSVSVELKLEVRFDFVKEGEGEEEEGGGKNKKSEMKEE